MWSTGKWRTSFMLKKCSYTILQTPALPPLTKIYTSDSPRFMAAYVSFYSHRILADAERSLYWVAACFQGKFTGKGNMRRLFADSERRFSYAPLRGRVTPFFVMYGVWPFVTTGIIFGLQFESISIQRNVIVVAALTLVTIAPFLQILVLEKRKRRCLLLCYRLCRVLKSRGGSGHKLWFYSAVENAVWMPFVSVGGMNILAGLFSVSTPKRGDIGASDVSIRAYFICLHFLCLWIGAAIDRVCAAYSCGASLYISSRDLATGVFCLRVFHGLAIGVHCIHLHLLTGISCGLAVYCIRDVLAASSSGQLLQRSRIRTQHDLSGQLVPRRVPARCIRSHSRLRAKYAIAALWLDLTRFRVDFLFGFWDLFATCID